MSLRELAQRHREMAGVERLDEEEMLLWYADLGVQVVQETVTYSCPRCGTCLSMPVEEFLFHKYREDLRCDVCRGDPEERGGPQG